MHIQQTSLHIHTVQPMFQSAASTGAKYVVVVLRGLLVANTTHDLACNLIWAQERSGGCTIGCFRIRMPWIHVWICAYVRVFTSSPGCVCRSASEARAGLDKAAKTKAALEAAVRLLGKARRPEDLAAVEAAVEAAKAESVPLDDEIRAAEEAVAHWQAAAAAEAKLAKALEDCNSSTALGWAVQVGFSPVTGSWCCRE